MLAFGERMALPVSLTRAQVEASPEAAADEPVTEAMEQRLFEHYGWDPFFGAAQLGGEPAVLRPGGGQAGAGPAGGGPAGGGPAGGGLAGGGLAGGGLAGGGMRLGGAAALKGFSVHATDGDAGSVDNVFLDDISWSVRYLVVATPGWLHGKLVRVPVAAVTGVDWAAGRVDVGVARERVNSAPEWDPSVVMAEDLVEQRLRAHFGAAAPGA